MTHRVRALGSTWTGRTISRHPLESMPNSPLPSGVPFKNRLNRLKADFDNGEPYYPPVGQRIWLPGRVDDHPSREFLEWHADTVYRG